MIGARALPLAALGLLLATAGAAAQGDDDDTDALPHPVPRLTGAIDLDGRVDEPAWEAIDPLPSAMHVPTFGGEPTERTEFRVAYDDRYLWFSCRAYDSDPAGIRAPSLERDKTGATTDWCAISIDTFNDNETSLLFGTTPTGLRTDVVIPADASVPGAFNTSWNTFWDAAVTRDELGWYAEIRIPLSSLRFQPEPGTDRVVMGLSTWRVIARKPEIHTWPAISPRWGGWSFVKASQFRDGAFTGIEPTTPLYVTPYVLGGGGRTWALDDPGTRYTAATDRVGDIGLDAKYGLASNLTLDLTVNTDFAQVEADDQQVNLTRFSLFFPEKRQFFQERSDIFDVSLGGLDRLFHSRRIGIVDGEQVPIHGGVRLVGRVGDWDVGVLDMQTAATAVTPSENMGVLRLRRRVFNAHSYVGGILTSRIAEAGRGSNVVYAADAVIRLFGQDYLALDIARAHDHPGPDADTAASALADQLLARLSWQRRVTDGLTYGLDLVRAGAAFEPGLGFLRRRDYTSAGGRLGYGWRPGQASPVLTHGPSLDASVFVRNDVGDVETLELQPRWEVNLKSGHTLTAAAAATYENLATGFRLPGGASVPPGEYPFAVGRIVYSPSSAMPLRTGARVEAGGFYDGRILSARLSPTWNVSRHLELGAVYQVDAVTFPDRDQAFTAHVARLRTRVMLSTKLSTFAFIQYSSTADRLAANLRFRYNPSEGHDLYIVWNEGLITDRYRLDPVPPLSERRTLLVKYSRTFTFGL